MRYARKKDTTHSGIVRGLRLHGFSVADTTAVGDDFPDAIIGKYGIDAKLEIKSPKAIHHQKGDGLSEGQKDFKDAWKGAPVIVATTIDEVLWQFNMLLKRTVNWSK